jgi:hypothetical protein
MLPHPLNPRIPKEVWLTRFLKKRVGLIELPDLMSPLIQKD